MYEYGVSNMYLKKVPGPRAVTLPDGTVLSRADLPTRETRRWVASRKLLVVRAVVYGLMTQEEAQDEYDISKDEFQEWLQAVSDHGTQGLKATCVKKNRQP